MSKRKNLFKVIGVTAMSALMVASMALPAGAIPQYTAINGTSTTLDKYLVMKNDATVPNATFTFGIAPGTAIAAANGTMEVLAGPTASTGGSVTAPTITSSVTFGPSDTTTAEADKGDKTVSFATTATTDEKFATKTLTADFSGVTFPEPGVYRYIVTENSSAQNAITNDSQRTRTLDVYVVDNGSGTLQVASYALHTGTAAPRTNTDNGTADVAEANAKLSDKSTGFTNKVATQNLTFSKTVSGNQGSKDKFFKFTVTTTGLQAADKFDVVMTSATAAPTKTAATVYTADDMLDANTTQIDGGKVTGDQLNSGKVFYLKDGESITIKGLSQNAKYSVTELPEDYASALTSGKDATSGTITTADIDTGYTNTRDGIIPTGVLMTAAPFAGIIGIGAAGAAAVLLGKKKSEEDED